MRRAACSVRKTPLRTLLVLSLWQFEEWWRRGESNPRPKSATPRSLHAYLSSLGFAFRAKNEQETQPASPMNLARALRTERFRPAHCMTPLTGPVSKARGSVRLIN